MLVKKVVEALGDSWQGHPTTITISYPKILIPFILRKPVLCRRVTLPAERKKGQWPQPAFAHALIVAPWLCKPFTDTDRIWTGQSVRNAPLHLTKLFSPGPLICILLISKITKLAVAFVWSVQLECTVSLDTWVSEKRVKCLRRKVGQARRLTLPLRKGEWTRWVSLPAEPTFCN